MLPFLFVLYLRWLDYTAEDEHFQVTVEEPSVVYNIEELLIEEPTP